MGLISSPGYNGPMRKFLVVIFLFLTAALIILSFSELQTLIATLQQGELRYIILGLALEGGYIFLEGLNFWSLYRLLGLTESLRHLVLVATAANFVNIIAPSAGIGWVATWIDDGRRNAHPTGKVTLAATLFLFFDYAAFLAVLALGFIVLIRRQNLQWGEVTAAGILLLLALALALLLYLGYRSPQRLETLLTRAARFINCLLHPFFRRPYLSVERAHTFAIEIGEGLRALPSRPSLLLGPFMLALLSKIILIGILASTFLAFNVPFSAGTLVGGFAIGYLFLIVSPTPSGIGIMEGAMALGLSTLRVDWSQAVLLTLIYRGLTFWIPLGIGAIAFRRLHWK